MRKLIPNQHLENSYPVNRNTTSLIIFGVPRSASTYTWQVMGDIYEIGVIRTHKFFNVSPAIPLVRTVRDWRDAIVSYWRSQYPDVGCMEREDIYQYVARYQEFIWSLKAWTQVQPKSPLLRFEETIVNPKKLFEVAESLGGPQITPDRRVEILEAHSVQVNRAISNNLRGIDKSTLLAQRHLHEASVGTWKDFMDDDNAKLFTELLADELEEWSYNVQEPPSEPPPKPPSKP